jgi:hypothetical protein
MLRALGLVVFLVAFAAPAHAVLVTVYDAKITHVEVWGNQFTVYLDKTHTAVACGHNNSFSVDTCTEAGKVAASTLLTAFAGGKKIQANVTDGTCHGDRPTVQNFYVFSG